MNTLPAPLPLEQYKQAGRDELELVIERLAKIERAADLVPGSMVEALVSGIASETAEEVIGYIESGWERIECPADWREQVMEALAS